MEIQILPLRGILVDGAELAFGMAQSEAETVLGVGTAAGNRCYYVGGELAIDYDTDGKVEFIEFLGGIDGILRPFIDGISVFEVSADAVAALLRQKNHDGGETAEQEYAVCFHAISVGVYREITPADVQEMMEEMRVNGIPTAQNEDLEADWRRANHWATLGLGNPGYYNG